MLEFFTFLHILSIVLLTELFRIKGWAVPSYGKSGEANRSAAALESQVEMAQWGVESRARYQKTGGGLSDRPGRF